MSRRIKKKSGYGKKILLTILVITLSLAMSGGLYAFHIAEKIKDRTTDDSKENGLVTDKDDNKSDNDKNDEISRKEDHITNILLIGTDNRKDGMGERSDAIIILTIDEQNKDMRLTSLMRDSYVHIPASKGRSDSWEKLNHSYAYGGVSLLMRTIKENFDIELDKYVKIDFGGFKSVVEILGGVDVYIENNEELNELNRCLLLDVYDDPSKNGYTKFRNILERARLLDARDEGAEYRIKDNPNITREEYNYIAEIADFKWETGNTHLDGRQTLAYSRMRHSTGGSFGRTSRQREVISLLMNKLPNISELKYLALAEEITNYVKTNMELGTMIDLARKVLKINNFDIKQMQVPPDELTEGRIYKGVYVFLMDIGQVKKVMHDFIFEDIDYVPSNYKKFDYRSSEYYYYVPPKPEKPPVEEKEEDVSGDNDNKDINEENDSNKDNSNDEDNSNGTEVSEEDDNNKSEKDNGTDNPSEETDNISDETENAKPEDTEGQKEEESSSIPDENTDNESETSGDGESDVEENPTEETNQGEDGEFEISEEE
ncbi:LCP family protein [Oceanirhabdus sp. W0125-5]|uniref:LCP family protein n=1 Tax=Oceanirhabdus sp. W0125-5 TaxID=2999116 RepID=UPI0022F33765|nr:LCP family protein [Oceanirhabdus sp. W0125-5]WBW99348.1 LCP family protein [Oceanirhabdus sp. W0125-5]